MKQFRLSSQVSLPTELTTRRTAIFGISGSGKSNTATVCIERLLAAGEQVVVIDPKGEGWGLQTSADGKKAGFDVIVFGQPRGDIPELREQHADQIADFVVDSGRSVVLSLLGFESDQSERRFVTAFFKRLYRRKSQMSAKTRTLVVLEEAHLFIPEQASGASGEMVGAIKRIARQGRAAGIGLMVVDQRPQDVAKSIVSQCELLICHQLVHKLDREALREWVRAYDREGQGDAFLSSLAELTSGEAWVWSPAWLHLFIQTRIDRRITYDSGATPDGSSPAAPKAKTNVDLDSLRSHLAKVVDDVKANDPTALKTELAKVRGELEKLRASKAVAPAVVPKIVEKHVLKDGQIDRLEKFINREVFFIESGRKLFDDLSKHTEILASAVRLTRAPASIANAVARPIARPSPPRAAPTPRVVDSNGAAGDLPNGETAILKAIAQYPEGADREQLTILTGYKRSTRDAYIQRLSGRGFITINGSGIQASQEGIAALGSDFFPLPTGDELCRHWLGKLPDGERKILEVLVQQYPAEVPRDSLEEATGFKRSTRDAYIQRLNARKLIQTVGRGAIKASAMLFD